MVTGWKHINNWESGVTVKLNYVTKIFSSYLAQEQRTPQLSKPKISQTFKVDKYVYDMLHQTFTDQFVMPIFPSFFTGTRNSGNHKLIEYSCTIYYLPFAKYLIDTNGVFGEIDTYDASKVTLKTNWLGVATGTMYPAIAGHLTTLNMQKYNMSLYGFSVEFEED